MIREYNGKRYDMSKAPRPWRDYTSSNPAVTNPKLGVTVWAGGSFHYQGTNYERGLELVAKGRAILKALEVSDA